MSFDVRPPGPGGAGAYDQNARIAPTRSNASRFARVYELEEARARRQSDIPPVAADRIPDEVWDEVDAAARLVDRLQSQGKHMIFDTDRLTGSVVAALIEPDGSISNVPLTDVVDPGAAASHAEGDANGGAVA